MSLHMSLRLPWHDRGWDGHVCDNPTANTYCSGEFGLLAHEIRKRKDNDKEEAIKRKPLSLIKEGEYVPPCLRTIQTFGGTHELPFVNEPKDFLHTKTVQIPCIDETIPPCTAGTWPYDRVFRRAEDAEEGTPEEFQERFTPAEAVDNIVKFFDGLTKRSLVFFYLNYDNPLNSERRKYVLVGAAELVEVSQQQAWERIDEEKARVYGNLVWNRFVTHAYGEGRGARLPYDVYLREKKDPSDIVVEIPEELSHHFKYVCRDFTDDEAVMLLRELAAALERGRESKSVEWEWDRQIDWVNKALDAVLKERGPFPGIASALEALGFERAILYVDKHIRSKGVKNARQHVLDRIAKPKLGETKEAVKSYEQVARTIKVLPDLVVRLLLDRLCLFELSVPQVKLIAGGDLVTEEDRKASGMVSDATAILENPYLITEEYDPSEPADRVAFHRIDQGIYFASKTGAEGVPGLDTFAPDDKRRLRAAAVRCLREAGTEGHSFLAQDQLLKAITRLKLPKMPEALGPILFARDLDFHAERLTVLKEASLTGWMLKTTRDDEDLIRGRVTKLQARKPIATAVKDWKTCLAVPKESLLPKALLEEVRKSQSNVLSRLASQVFSILTGGAGTGKTTVISTLIKGLLEAGEKEKFVLLTPTGKAAVRLRSKILEVAKIDLAPRTIHSYLLGGGWMEENTFRILRDGQPIADGGTTVIIDECSMLNTVMLAALFKAIDWRTVKRLILAGDPQQLPPIGVGAPFKNLVDFMSVSEKAHRPCALDLNCRQMQENSTALKLAEQFTPSASRVVADELLDSIRGGGRIGVDLEVRYFKDEKDLPDALQCLLGDAVGELLTLNGSSTSFDPQKPWLAFDELHGYGGNIGDMRLDAFEVISPYRSNFFGADALNLFIQKQLRGKLMGGWGTKKLGNASGRQFVWTDKVIQSRNRRIKAYEKLASIEKTAVEAYVANGELGRVMKVGDFGKGKAGWLRFETCPEVSIRVDQKWARDWLELGYAMSVHRSQGSDFGGVVVVIPKEAKQRLVSRELLYTALTRFTKRLYLLIQGNPGDPEALLSALWRGSSEYLRRNTSLYSMQQAIIDIDEYLPYKRIIRTLRDDLVASKSEALIANMLLQNKIPYHYEKLLLGSDGSYRRPDFTIPVETADGPAELYWEHWGMLGDPAYDESVKRRKEWYKRHGFAEQLVETDEVGGFNSTKIGKVIQDKILP